MSISKADISTTSSYRQVFLPDDEVEGLWKNWPIHGVPVSWVPVSEVWLFSLRIDPDRLAETLGISFRQRIDLGNGLGDRPTAVLELASGLQINFMLDPTRGQVPRGHDVIVNVDPTTVGRPFVDGFGHEMIVERYQDELIDDVMAALDLPHSLIDWRVGPRCHPPLTTNEGMAKLEAIREQARAPQFRPGDPVRVFPQHDTLKRLDGEPGTVRHRWLRRRYRGTGPHTFAPGEYEALPYEWAYWVDVHGPQRSWLLWEDELEVATSVESPPAPIGGAP